MRFFLSRRGLICLVIALFLVGFTSWLELKPSADVTAAVLLDPSERKWLEAHPEITLAPQAWFYPFEFFDDSGTYRGVAADYIALIEQRLGVHFKILRAKSPTQWLANVSATDVDILAATETGSAPVSWMRVTRPHLIFPGVIVAGAEYPDLASLSGKKVAVVTGQPWEAYLTAKSAQIQILSMPDTPTALEAISSGTVSAMVSDMATVSYYIHREGMTDIQIVGQLDKNLELGIATRKDWPELHLIMEKALDSISDEEHAAIARQWIHLKVPALILGETFWILLSSSLVTVLLIFFGFILWNRSLRRQVATRTQNLKQELEWRTAAELEIQEAYDRLSHSHNALKQTQLQLIRAAKMESVGSLAAGVAHEVKNPLTQIRLGLDYLSEVVVQNLDCHGVLKDMNKAVGRADSVINSLLDFSRESTISRNLCSLNQVIEDSLGLVQHELTMNKIQVVMDLQKHLPRILLDENKIHQVFINLFQNAAQEMSSNGTLQISTFKGGWPGKNLLIAEVKDSGPGVSPENMDKLFDPFYTTKPVGKGTGLGLYVTKNILELHEAKIEFINLGEGGLVARILFPAE